MELFGQQWGGNQAPRCHVKPGTHRKPRGRDGNSSTELYTRTYASTYTSTWTPTNMYRNVHLYTNMPARTDTSNNKQTHAIMRKNTQNPQPNTESLLKINYKPPEDRKTNTAFKLSNIIRHDCARIIPTTSPEYNGEHTWSFTGKCVQLSRCFQPIGKLQKQISLSDIYFFLFLRGHNACFLLISHMMTFTRNNPFISCVKKKKNAHTIFICPNNKWIFFKPRQSSGGALKSNLKRTVMSSVNSSTG